jgi:diaminopimelate epimerase
MLRFIVTIRGRQTTASILNTGEPHIVVVTDDLDGADMDAIGKEVNADRQRFPEYVNVNLMKVLGPHEVGVRTYERGVFKETMACGTGTTACASAAVMLGLVGQGPVKVHARGGDLTIELHPDGKASMTGPAIEVYEGRVKVKV